MFVFVFFLGSRKIIAGTMTLGAFVAFQFYLGRMIWPLIALGWVINLFQRGMASMKRLHEVWSVPSATSMPTDDVPMAAARATSRSATSRSPTTRAPCCATSTSTSATARPSASSAARAAASRRCSR